MQDYCFHIHTPRCGHADVNMPDELIARIFFEAGFKTIAFTDHCPWKTFLEDKPNHGMKWSEKEGYLNSIHSLSKEYEGRMHIFTGYEMEYNPELKTEMKELYNDSQLLVIGQHYTWDENGNCFSMHRKGFVPDDYERDCYARCLENACKEGYATILAHPDLYMIQKDNPDKKDIEIAHRICETAVTYDTPIEINMCLVSKNKFFKPCQITYPRRVFWEVASQYKNLKVLFGLDFHGHFHPDNFDMLQNETINCIGADIVEKLHICTAEELTARFRTDC